VIPAIGANPLETWKHPKAESSSTSIYHEIEGVLVQPYLFPSNFPSSSFEECAADLVEVLRQISTPQSYPLHIAAHSTGGLALKAAVNILWYKNRETFRSLSERCTSVAFFGVPRK
jgi:hypothetical protein